MEKKKIKSNKGNYLDGVLLITPNVFEDERGYFYESWNKKKFNEITQTNFLQDNHSRSFKGVLRGLHYQLNPYPQEKLVRCTIGKIFDVAVDLRINSNTYKEWIGIELNEINKFKTVNPKPSINRLIQHRLAEKDFVNKLNIRTTRYVGIEKKSDLETLDDFLPGILKTATMGYDGKGQYPIKSLSELNGINIDFSKEYILEKLVKLKKEISVIVTRFGNNRYEIYEAIENIHENQILKKSKIPADLNIKLIDESREWSKQISEELKYIGTLCVEFFIDRNDNLYVNEIAPRVHNSGHLTINAFNISQFENHIRAICSLEQIPLKKLHNAEMINLIGNQITPYRKNINLNDNEFFFDYQKKEIKDKRKMGHLTKIL